MSLSGLLNALLFFIATLSVTSAATDYNTNATVSNTVRCRAQQATPVDYHTAMLDAVNKERITRGLPKLCMNKKLQNAALLHSMDMAKKGFLGHTGSDGSTISSRVKTAKYRWTYVAENVAAGQTTIANVVASWMKSKGHRANILSPKAKMFECGYAYSPSSKYKHYWTQSFASGKGETCN